jgi:BASS family bile acid:Na+ symporter
MGASFVGARALSAAFLIFMMLSTGLQLGGEPPADKAAKRHKWLFVLVGLVFNFVMLPLLALVLTLALHVSDAVAVAFLLLAASPGGRSAPQIARYAGADVGLSVEITIFLAKFVSLTAPVTAALLLHSHKIEIRELPFIVQLILLQMAPYILGRQLRKRKPELAARIARPVDIAMLISFAALAVLIATHVRGLATLAGMHGWRAVITFAVLAPTLGWLLGGARAGTRRAIAISANARDVALASMLANLGFDSKVHAATIAIWLLLILFNLALVRFVWRRPIGAGFLQPFSTRTVTGGSS